MYATYSTVSARLIVPQAPGILRVAAQVLWVKTGNTLEFFRAATPPSAVCRYMCMCMHMYMHMRMHM